MVGILFCLLLAGGCSGDSTTGPPRPVPIDQGLTGLVRFWEGNFQPSISPAGSSGQIRPVRREVRVHELTHLNQVDELGGGFYTDVRSPLIGSVWSDESGHFEIPLAPGRYSLFVIENGLHYANGGDGSGNIWPVEVRPDEVDHIVFDIDYQAAY